MELLMRIVAGVLHCIGLLLYPFIVIYSAFKGTKTLPPIKSDVLRLSATDLAAKIRSKQITSESVVKAYIERIKDVNPVLNAVVEDRFDGALKDAKRADDLCATMTTSEIATKYPLLGVPFTVKESCGLKGLSFVIGSLPRKGLKAPADSEVVENLKAAGGIPLLVSANPEFCLSWECNNLVNGVCTNAYNSQRTSGGSSGGEGALNGAGASVFGVGSDIAGSIRVPSLFNGIFGHKPTGGLLSVKGHFPQCEDKNFPKYLQLGPMTRFARDLPLLLQIMAGKNADKLKFMESIDTKDIKINYLLDAGFSLITSGVDTEIKVAILRAVNFFKQNGIHTHELKLPNMQDTLEVSLSSFFEMTDIPDMLIHPDNPNQRDNLYQELLKFAIGKPKYSFHSLFFILLQETGGFIAPERRTALAQSVASIRTEFMKLLGTNGVLFYPTFHCTALRHNTSFTNLPGVMYTMLFNILGFPSTHVPMGLSKEGLPIGFQVIAAPYQDKLCLTIAAELEVAFGGWVPPS